MDKREIARAIKEFLDENYKNNITLHMISEKLFISHSTVCHYFREVYGTTIKQYINTKRALEAKRLIEIGVSPTVVCEKLGFYNYTTFYRIYKKQFGFSPSNKTLKK